MKMKDKLINRQNDCNRPNTTTESKLLDTDLPIFTTPMCQRKVSPPDGGEKKYPRHADVQCVGPTLVRYDQDRHFLGYRGVGRQFIVSPLII